jgi:hypothetical protein
MAKSPEEIKRDLQATLAARRELGPEYDDHFLDALAEKMSTQVKQTSQTAQTALPATDTGPRLALAICSLIFGIPLVAIASSSSLIALVFVCLTILGINFAFNMHR